VKGGGGVVSNEPVSERRGSAKGAEGTERERERDREREKTIIKDQGKVRCDLSSRPFRASEGEAAQHIGELKEKKKYSPRITSELLELLPDGEPLERFTPCNWPDVACQHQQLP